MIKMKSPDTATFVGEPEITSSNTPNCTSEVVVIAAHTLLEPKLNNTRSPYAPPAGAVNAGTRIVMVQSPAAAAAVNGAVSANVADVAVDPAVNTADWEPAKAK